jgi:hypothetical protein
MISGDWRKEGDEFSPYATLIETIYQHSWGRPRTAPVAKIVIELSRQTRRLSIEDLGDVLVIDCPFNWTRFLSLPGLPAGRCCLR